MNNIIEEIFASNEDLGVGIDNQKILENKPIKIFDAFAGYGGAHFGLKKANVPHEVIGYSEFDEHASKLYELNHGEIKNYGDITKVDPKNLPDFDLFTGGFPCQPFSMAGKGLGVLDTRGTLFFDIIRICEVKKPDHILLENVKGLTFRNHKPTFEKMISELERLGYNVTYEILNTKNYGIPQNRERLWIFATKRKIPLGWTFKPREIELNRRIKDFLDINVDKKYYLSDKQINRLIEIHKVDFNVDEPLCFDVYNKKVKKDGICITLTEPHHNTLRIVEPPKNGKFVVRKLTEREHFRLMGFKDDEIDFGDLTYIQMCKRAGNGWDINLASKILKNIYEFVNEN